MKLEKIAEKDAFDWALAEMFFGEGAGTRRKLLDAEILHKQSPIPGYYELFIASYNKQNMAEHAIKAAKERQNLDRIASLGKNTRALARGDIRGMSTGLSIVVGVAVVAHQTGYDKIAYDKAKQVYNDLKVKKEKS